MVLMTKIKLTNQKARNAVSKDIANLLKDWINVLLINNNNIIITITLLKCQVYLALRYTLIGDTVSIEINTN